LTLLTSSGIKTKEMPRKIRQLISDLEKAGFALTPGGKGRIANSGIHDFPAR
jgi:hypothetical protein